MVQWLRPHHEQNHCFINRIKDRTVFYSICFCIFVFHSMLAMFSKTCEYAIRALIFIGQQTQEGHRVGVKGIAEGIDSPEYFIAKILQELSRKGFVQSMKGPNGGFFLSDENKTIPLAKLVREIDGDKLFTACAMGLKECSETRPCPLHHKFKATKDAWIHTLETSTLADLVESVEQDEAFLKHP